MTKDKLEEVQEHFNNEFDKAFKIKVGDKNYKVALSNDDIPVVKSFTLENHKIHVVFADHIFPNCQSKYNNLIVIEDPKGNIQAATLDFEDFLSKNTFTTIRKEIEPMYSIHGTHTISDSINLEKRKKLLHALYDVLVDFLKKNNDYNVNTQGL